MTDTTESASLAHRTFTYLGDYVGLSKGALAERHPLFILGGTDLDSAGQPRPEVREPLNVAVASVDLEDEHGGGTPRSIAKHQHLLARQVYCIVTHQAQQAVVE